MKRTGIIRRTDDLGRITIPREIRRTMGIQDGCPIEIFLDNNETIVLKKYDIAAPYTDRIENLLVDLGDDYHNCDFQCDEVIELLKQAKEILSCKDTLEGR